jgi:nucleotide-binding universal stress UspA family protein
MQRLLVPVDGSEAAEKAARFAATLARALGASITLVYAYDGAQSAAAAARAGLSMEVLDEHEAKHAQDVFARARSAMAGVEVKEHLIEVGPPAEHIVDTAKRLQVDQIIMGSRGLSLLKELLLGSVSERVLRSAHCPVTIVR